MANSKMKAEGPAYGPFKRNKSYPCIGLIIMILKFMPKGKGVEKETSVFVNFNFNFMP